VNYHGTTLDGKVFDSSYERGQPAEFALNQVIAGWTEGVALMPVGSKFRFWIPSELAYGPKGAGELIGPHATLVFDVELMDILQ
jgi:FKBP-type peptidyl-prolyl cis-trans isomerase FkpA